MQADDEMAAAIALIIIANVLSIVLIVSFFIKCVCYQLIRTELKWQYFK